MAVNLFHSLVDIMEIPYRKIENIVNPTEAGLKKEPFLEDLTMKLKRKKEEIEKVMIFFSNYFTIYNTQQDKIQHIIFLNFIND